MQFILVEQIEDDDADLEGLRTVISDAAREHGFKLHTVMDRPGVESMFEGVDRIMERTVVERTVVAEEQEDDAPRRRGIFTLGNFIVAGILITQIVFFFHLWFFM